MYKLPTVQDFQRSLDNCIHEAEHYARSERGRLIAEYAARGLAQSGALISTAVKRVDEIHKAATEKAMNLVHEFVRQAGMSPTELATVAKQRLENLGVFLIGQVPSAGLDGHHLQQFQQQYTAVFAQRVEGAVRDIEVGIIAGQGVSIKDTDLRNIVLRKFYENRLKGWTAIPTSPNADAQERIKITSICEQLAQKHLIEWKGLPGVADGMGRITAQGIDYIERVGDAHTSNVPAVPQRRKSEKFEILDSPKHIESDIAEANGALGIACLYMDLDGFKALNSRFSESIVDKDIIPPFQKLLIAALGHLGFAYQEGGDEIVVVLPNTTLGMATEFSETFRRMLSERVFTVNGADEVQLKASVGIAHVGNEEDRAQLKEKANHALRQAKETGRDKIYVYDGQKSTPGVKSHSGSGSDLLAIGPDIICIGDVAHVTTDSWTLRPKQFIAGDEYKLVAFIDGFANTSPENRYVLSNSYGDGRLLAAAPSLSKESDGYRLLCPVSSAFPRSEAKELGSDMAIHPETDDLYIKDGQIARVSGLEYLPQKIRSLLSMQRGESVFARTFGMRFFEYFEAYKTSPWLSAIMMLDVVRQAAIPYNDNVMKQQYTPLRCINRVHNVELLSETPTNNKLPIRLDLDVRGVGRWQHDIEIYMPTSEQMAERAQLLAKI